MILPGTGLSHGSTGRASARQVRATAGAGTNAGGDRVYRAGYVPWGTPAGKWVIGGASFGEVTAIAWGIPYVKGEAQGISCARYNPGVQPVKVKLLAEPGSLLLIGARILRADLLRNTLGAAQQDHAGDARQSSQDVGTATPLTGARGLTPQRPSWRGRHPVKQPLVQPANETFFRHLGRRRRGEPELYVGIPHVLMDIDLRTVDPGA